MSGSNYGTREKHHPPMHHQERIHARLDFDKAEDANTDAARKEWFTKWGRRVADNLWDGTE